MGKYREVRNIIMEVLSDREWHKIDELQKKCEVMGIGFEGGRGPIYNAVHQLKKKGKIEANGNGAYRICEKNVNDKEENETTQEGFYKYDDELAESIKNIEKHLEKYKNFNWINCREDELQEARFYANKLIKLSEKIRNEIGM